MRDIGVRSVAGRPAPVRFGLLRAVRLLVVPAHRVHCVGIVLLGPALLTVTLNAAHAQALAVLLAALRELPRQTPAAEAELRWGAGPAETAAASLAVALAAYGSGTYARVLDSGHVTAGLTLSARPAGD
ncbi:hypothetical protein ACFWWM_27055 [Streptomyces sp. NPDC058682]|uniref:hypothetical protein n=1 Tax=Streptomyces sp. NPDC058682 TaxID=3346596 RepID=UPI00364792EA